MVKKLLPRELEQVLALLARDRNNIGANIKAGVLYLQHEMWEKSAFHLKKALNHDKKNALLLEKLAEVLIKSRKPMMARKYARALLALNKRSAQAMHTMAKTYYAMPDIENALHWINMALNIEPENEGMLSAKAEYLSISGEIEEATRIHRKILRINPDATNSWWPLVQMGKMQGEEADEAIQSIKKAMEKHEEGEQLRELHFALGKLAHDTEDYDQAFANLEKANLMHAWDITAGRIKAVYKSIRNTYSANFYDSHKNHGFKKAQPIFIVGQTRSGTTLSESFCSSHSRISAGGELHLFADYNKALQCYSPFETEYQKHIYGLSDESIKAYAVDFIGKTKHMHRPNQRLIDKLPHNFLNIGLIALVFPNAKIIHCRRHPMDNCLSIFSNPMLDYHKEYKSNLETLGKYYRNYVQIMEFWKETCPIPIHDVFYEDLVTNTESVAKGMIEYIGEDWEDSVMDRSGSQKAVKTLSVWQVRQPVFQSSKGKWRNYEKQLQPLRDVLGDTVDDYEKELADLA